MEYVVQDFRVLKNLVHAEANTRAQKTGFFVAFLTSQGPVHEFVCISFRTGNLNCFRVK